MRKRPGGREAKPGALEVIVSAPQVGCQFKEIEEIWSNLNEVVESVPRGERVMIGADFNRHEG